MAITAKFFFDAASQQPNEITHVDSVIGVATIDLPAIAGNQVVYGIVINYDSGAGSATKMLTYATQALRNTGFTNLKSAIAAQIV